MSNAEKHLQLLQVPQRERNKNWHDKVNNLLTDVEYTCANCHTHFTRKIFTDERLDQPINNLCVICEDENKKAP